MTAPFRYRHRVRYHEIDAQGHAYNSRYLEYVDDALTEFLRDLGWPYPEAVAAGFDPILAHVEIDFRRAARFDELLEVEVRVTRLGSSSLEIGYAVRGADGGEIAEIAIVYVNFDATARDTRPIPDQIRARLAPLLAPPDLPDG